MWSRVSKLASKKKQESLPQPQLFTAEDEARVDKIIEKISAETFQIFDLMKDGMVRQASFKTVEESITRNYILATFAQVRAEAFRDAAEAARQFAHMCVDASNKMNESHQRVIAKCVAELFERFAGQIDRPEMPGEGEQPANLLLLSDERPKSQSQKPESQKSDTPEGSGSDGGPTAA